MNVNDPDTQIRLAAFDHVRRLGELHSHLTSSVLESGFSFNGEHIRLLSRPVGIFKPKNLRYMLSIKSVFPRGDRPVWYDDQTEVLKRIFENDEAVDYAFQGQNPDRAANRWLREAFENKIPVIYFLGISPACYQALIPTFISGWDRSGLKARITFGFPGQEILVAPESNEARRYAHRLVKQRLHQASFREAIISAYGGRCALSGLPEQRLLDAAHIISDGNEQLGQAVVPNGLPLSKIHHAAFDAHLIGVDPDYQLYVSDRLLHQKDGPMLEALKHLHKGKLKLPKRKADYPDRDRLAERFELFKAAA